jgi:hypothetical protein
MKRTEVEYQVVDDETIYIKEIRNVAAPSKLRKEFGGDVAAAYLKASPAYFASSTILGSSIVVYTEDTRREIALSGATLSHEEFGKLINILKASGDRLQKCKQLINKETKTILI